MATNVSTPIPAVATDREKLRDERKLKPVKGAIEGDSIEFLPAGVYGFTYSPMTEGVPLFSMQTYQIFEVHKLADGSVHYLGYMSPEEAAALNTATDAIDVTLYPEAWEKAQSFVSVSRDRVLKSRTSSRDNGNFVPLTLAPQRG